MTDKKALPDGHTFVEPLQEPATAVAAVVVDQAQAPAAKVRRVLTDRSQLLAAKDLRIKEVAVPEWADDDPTAVVLVRNLTAEGRGMFIQRTIEVSRQREIEAELARSENRPVPMFDDDRNTEAFLVALCVCDENGCPVFTPEDVEALTKKSAAPIMRIASVAQNMSALTKEAQEQAVKI